MSKAKRAAIYLRVSTSEQTTENQRRELVKVAEQRGWDIVEGGQGMLSIAKDVGYGRERRAARRARAGSLRGRERDRRDAPSRGSRGPLAVELAL